VGWGFGLPLCWGGGGGGGPLPSHIFYPHGQLTSGFGFWTPVGVGPSPKEWKEKGSACVNTGSYNNVGIFTAKGL
jgi:hypothetical protein